VRILYLTEQYTPHDFRFLNSLAKTEHEVFAMQFSSPAIQKETRALPERVVPIKSGNSQMPFSWRRFMDYRRAVRQGVLETKPDLIHAGPIQHVAFIAVMTADVPVLSMSWGSDLLLNAEKNLLNQWITGYTLKRSAGFAGDCQPVKESALAYGVNEKDVFIFPWGIDLERFSPAGSSNLREQLSWQNQFVVLSNRSWEPLYGVDTVVKAFIKASAFMPELRLLLLGNGSMKDQILSLIDASGFKDRVHITGQINNDHLADYYRASDLYVSASYSDGSSVSLMEALACGLPALVSDIPGNREWVTEGVEGWKYSAGDSEQLAKKIVSVCTERQGLNSYKLAARKKAEMKANWVENFKILLHAYEHVYSKRMVEKS